MIVRLALSALLLTAVSCVGRPPTDATGEEIYLQLCSNCHGENLEGGLGPALGAGSNSALLSDEFLVVSITDGRGRMPSFQTSLDDEQLSRLIGYLRSEQNP